MAEKITPEEWAETNRKISEMFREIEEETIRKMPLWMRMNYYGNKLNRAIENGHTEDDINWDKVYEPLTKDLSPFDYNMLEPMHSIADFHSQRFNVIAASEGVGVWHKHICKDCGNDFYMLHNEAMFYQSKGLNLPKRCKECRKKRNGGIK